MITYFDAKGGSGDAGTGNVLCKTVNGEIICATDAKAKSSSKESRQAAIETYYKEELPSASSAEAADPEKSAGKSGESAGGGPGQIPTDHKKTAGGKERENECWKAGK